MTVARAAAAIAAGKIAAHQLIRTGRWPLPAPPALSALPLRSASSRHHAFTDASLLSDFSIQSPSASISSGVEVESNEVVVLGNSPHWAGPLAHRASPDGRRARYRRHRRRARRSRHRSQPAGRGSRRRADQDRASSKCEPDRRGRIRGHRHTMLDDTDINAQRHIRGAVAGLVAGVIGDGRIFVSGGAEHQGPDGGGLIAVIASQDTGSV